MNRLYQADCKVVRDLGFEPVSTCDEYCATETLRYMCDKGHTIVRNQTAFQINDKTKAALLCTECQSASVDAAPFIQPQGVPEECDSASSAVSSQGTTTNDRVYVSRIGRESDNTLLHHYQIDCESVRGMGFEPLSTHAEYCSAKKLKYKCARGHTSTVAKSTLSNHRGNNPNIEPLKCADCRAEERRVKHQANKHRANKRRANKRRAEECQPIPEPALSELPQAAAAPVDQPSSSSAAPLAATQQCQQPDVQVPCPVDGTKQQSNKKRPGVKMFNNHSTYIRGFGCSVISDFDEFQNNSIVYKCPEGHISSYTVTGFISNGKVKGGKEAAAALHGQYAAICQDCKDNQATKKQQQTIIEDALKRGRTVTKFIDKRRFEFTCNNCERKSRTEHGNIIRDGASSYCIHCIQSMLNKRDKDEVAQEVAEYGFELIEYKNNKDVSVRCPTCKNAFNTSMFHFKRGRRCTFQECVVNRRRATNLKVYGAINVLVSEKIKRLMQELHGSEYFLTSETCNKQMLENNGAENAMHCPKLFYKACKTRLAKCKPYILPRTKRALSVVGYEKFAIHRLLTEGENPHLGRRITEDEILVCEDVRSFAYEYGGKSCVYYPDIAIRDTQLVYEVKSVYTFNRDPARNYAKFKAVTAAGYTLVVFFFTARGSVVDVWKFKGDDELSMMAVYHGVRVEFSAQFNLDAVLDKNTELQDEDALENPDQAQCAEETELMAQQALKELLGDKDTKLSPQQALKELLDDNDSSELAAMTATTETLE